MITLTLTDAEQQTQLRSLDAAARNIGTQLQQSGLAAVEGAIPHLQSVLALILKIQAAADAAKAVPAQESPARGANGQPPAAGEPRQRTDAVPADRME